jgi:hypothetical protein
MGDAGIRQTIRGQPFSAARFAASKAGAEIPVTARATGATAADGTVIAAATETIVVTAVGVANLKTTERAQRGCIPGA